MSNNATSDSEIYSPFWPPTFCFVSSMIPEFKKLDGVEVNIRIQQNLTITNTDIANLQL